MTGLKDLSTELLLFIASYLPSGALHSLALTSKELSTAAYDELYKKLHLPTPDGNASDWSHRIFFLVRTLSMRPHLAERIVELDVSVCSRNDDLHSGGPIAAGSSAIGRILDVVPVGSQLANERWVREVYSASSEAWLGLLLYMLPNLEDLTARFFDRHDEYPPMAENASFRALFEDPEIDLNTVPGLRKVKNLELHCKASTWKLCCLPNLKRMRLGPNVDLSLHYEICEPSSQVEEIYTEQASGILLPPAQPMFLHERHLRSTSFSTLRRLSISLDNGWGHIDAENIGSFANLLPKIEPMVHTLEELRVTVLQGTYPVFLNLVDPVPVDSLNRFYKLKVLEVPQALILPRGFDHLASRSDFSMTDYSYLPTTLEALQIS
ncbi:uncharacterized protein N0V89_003529 [Didymosphaeria variabile]|uniref:F-box domain-containing protein n=1 Tax=Didymosphaeria variabile TaxID=1932322 RepID=A0A9W9CCL3_9PLEO|nr:uncharacterized protein N0V89_003529 [Didymosphaeria variabile]KAJ4355512.1 hypothetical protein N0V89_003529 [Didymosphaeria variabile]